MNILCTNLNSPVCHWLGRTYEPESKEFVIPRRGRIPLDEDSVYCTLGVPNGGMDVPYKVDRKIQDRLFPEMFPGMKSMPLKSAAATMLSQMTTSGDEFKRLLLMYIISTVFAPTTSLHLSSRGFPVVANLANVPNMNWCKFIAGFLHTALANKIFNNGCRLHMMLTYVDNLDISKVNLKVDGGLPKPHKFAATAWSDAAIKAVLDAGKNPDGSFGKLQLMAKHSVDYSFFGGPDNFSKWMDVHSVESCSLQVRSNVEALVGEFASGMNNLLGNMVHGWTAMTLPDGAEVAKHFRSFVPGGSSRPIGSRARYVYRDSQELPDSEEEFANEGGSSDDDDDDYVGADDGPSGDAEMDNVYVDPVDEDPQQADVAAAVGKGKVPARASDRSTTGVEVSKRARDPEVAVADIPAKRSKLDPVATRKSEATAGGRVSKAADVGQPPRSSPRLKKAPRKGANPAREPSHTSTRSSPRFASCNTGDPVVCPRGYEAWSPKAKGQNKEGCY